MTVWRADPTEYRAATQSAAWLVVAKRARLEVVGPDRVSFVQGMVTQDIEKLPEGSSTFAAALTAKGSMVADLRIFKAADAVVLDVDSSRLEALQDFLGKYLISEDAELRASRTGTLLGVRGPQAETLKAQVDPSKAVALFGCRGGGVDVLVDEATAQTLAELWREVPQLSQGTVEVLRIEAGVPAWGAELGEETIPLEANLADAIAYTKGCYIGQEVIARATYRGRMVKNLCGLLVEGSEPKEGDGLFVGEKRVGTLTSVAQSFAAGQLIALGFVHRDAQGVGTRLATASGGAATVTTLPFRATT